MKYKISKDFFPFSHLIVPIPSAKLACWIGTYLMKPPLWLKHDRQVKVTKRHVTSYDGQKVVAHFFEPNCLTENAPCLVYYHGGGFWFGAAHYHYKIAKKYALQVGCKVVFAQYRLMPKHQHPTPAEDCFAIYKWTVENAEQLHIDKNKIAVGGDSAGGALATAVCQMARDRNYHLPLFQLLIYPVTDKNMDTSSQKQFVDTPMWNAKLNAKMWKAYLPENATDVAYASPMDATTLQGLPDAYVETAQFDCLHDEDINYAQALQCDGVAVELFQTQGTMHGFDIVAKSPITQQAVQRRIEFMKNRFYQTDK